MKEAGQIAYEAFCDAFRWTTEDGTHMVGWEQLSLRRKDAWRAAAHAAVQGGWLNAQHGRYRRYQRDH